MNEILTPNARLYATRRQFEIAETLGSGKDGIVLVARRKAKPGDVAIKVHRFSENYLRERQAYQRLGDIGIGSVLGFNVPQMEGFDDDLLVIEMSDMRSGLKPAYIDRESHRASHGAIFSPLQIWSRVWRLRTRACFRPLTKTSAAIARVL